MNFISNQSFQIEFNVHWVVYPESQWIPSHQIEGSASVDEFLYNRISTLDHQLETLTRSIVMAGIVVPGYDVPGNVATTSRTETEFPHRICNFYLMS